MVHPQSVPSSVATAWLVALVAAIWALAGTAPLVLLSAVAIIGAVPPVVVLVLARHPTMSEAIRAVCSRRVDRS
jgi:hypothetical protein